MSMTNIEPTHRAEPPSESESEQMEAAFQAALEQLPPNTGLSHAVRERARALFEVGWISGVRTGHTGPALAGVPLPPEMFSAALASLAARSQDSGPGIGQLVSYHGSQERAWGRYWVTGIDRQFSRWGREYVLYRLSDYRSGVFVTALSGVHAESITALPLYWQRRTS
ncbi:hypothetical protein ACFW4O_36765 [Streptomyces mutabilis]|uniref:hypothetical protein n=1 Tax=Streptomyces mutabilis TaxID=67332 RepID=UPI0036A7D32B